MHLFEHASNICVLNWSAHPEIKSLHTYLLVQETTSVVLIVRVICFLTTVEFMTAQSSCPVICTCNLMSVIKLNIIYINT